MLTTTDFDPGLIPGVRSTTRPAPDMRPVESAEFEPPPLVPFSTTAKALYSVWSGNPVTVVSSPPGAGKSTLVSHVIAHLWQGTKMTIGVGTVSHAATNELAGRIAALVGPGVVVKAAKKQLADTEVLPPWVDKYQAGAGRRVIARVTSSWKGVRDQIDLLVIDEAWQLTYADLCAVASSATQILLIGDPGQTEPIVLVQPETWRDWDSPALPGPVVMSQRDDVRSLTMPHTFRLGQDTVDCIAPLYDFEFSSGRPARSITGRQEIMISSLGDNLNSVQVGEALASLAQGYIGRQLNGVSQQDKVFAEDVCVVVARNHHVSSVETALAKRNVHGVTVGTANSLQGGQWHAVVALAPEHGQTEISAHSASLGRLCVMASRHLTSLTWVTGSQWRQAFTSSDLPALDVRRHLAVREALIRHTNRGTHGR